MDQETESEVSEDDEDAATEDAPGVDDVEDTSMLSLGEEELLAGNPYWLLFKAVVTHTDERGNTIAKPFQTLPNRRYPLLYVIYVSCD